MSLSYIIIVILCMYLATFSVRLIPLVWFNRKTLPKPLQQWLSYVPVTVFSALCVQMVLDEIGSGFHFIAWFPFLIAIAIAFLITFKTRSLSLGMGLGFASFVVSFYLLT